jgi:hypothetical protein
MSNFSESWKERIKKNKTHLAMTTAGIAILGCTYFIGKTNGNLTINAFLHTADGVDIPLPRLPLV